MANVICPECRGRYHETTDKFDPEALADGSMFRLKQPYADWGWQTFSREPQGYGVLECPNCGAPYAPGGHVLIDGPVQPTARKAAAPVVNPRQSPQRNVITQFACPKCSASFENARGLAAHMRVHRAD